MGPVSNARKGRFVLQLVRGRLGRSVCSCSVQGARCTNRTSRVTTRTTTRRASVMITVNKSNAVGRVKQTLVRAGATVKVVPYNSKGKLTHRLRVPVRPGKTVGILGTKGIGAVSCNVVSGRPFFYAYKIKFSTFMDLGFTSSKGENLLACLRGALRRDLACRPRACRVRGSANAMHCGTFLVTYTGTSRCNGGTCVTPRTSLASKVVSVAILRPFAILSIPSLSFRLFGQALSRGDHVGAVGSGDVVVRHTRRKIFRFSKSPVVNKGSLGIRVVRRKLRIVTPVHPGRVPSPPLGVLRRFASFVKQHPVASTVTRGRGRLLVLGRRVLEHLSGGWSFRLAEPSEGL